MKIQNNTHPVKKIKHLHDGEFFYMGDELYMKVSPLPDTAENSEDIPENAIRIKDGCWISVPWERHVIPAKIDLKAKIPAPDTKFAALQPCDIFSTDYHASADSHIYMKLGETDKWNAVRLTDGSLQCFPYDRMVYKKENVVLTLA